jgi:hypothetical protein
MAFFQGPCDSFKSELLLGVHDFSTDAFKLALYTDEADLGQLTTAYTPSGEVQAGGGYTAGGVSLVASVGVFGGTAAVTFADLELAGLTFEATRGGLIYNSTKADRAVYVLDFGIARRPTGGTLRVAFPVAGAQTALIRIS